VEINAMTIGKIRIVSTNDTPDVQSKGGKPRARGCIPKAAPAGEEGLRLMQAFCKITDPSQRIRLIEAAEGFARAGGPR
jgi:hypothetical protein